MTKATIPRSQFRPFHVRGFFAGAAAAATGGAAGGGEDAAAVAAASAFDIAADDGADAEATLEIEIHRY